MKRIFTAEQQSIINNYGIKKGMTVYTMLVHVSSSGMTRAIKSFIVVDNKPVCIDYLIVKLNIAKFNNKHGGVTRHGCGMDMGFNLVYNLSAVLFGDVPRSGYELSHQWL